MTKKFCDRCGKETELLLEISVPDQKGEYQTFSTKPKEVCIDCKNLYDNLIGKITDFRFWLFEKFF